MKEEMYKIFERTVDDMIEELKSIKFKGEGKPISDKTFNLVKVRMFQTYADEAAYFVSVGSEDDALTDIEVMKDIATMTK